MWDKLEIKENSFAEQREGKNIKFETGKIAPQADGAIVVTLGDTALLVTAVMEKNPNQDKDFTPLMIDFRESFSAAGKIGGASFTRREAKPADTTILAARLTDRPIRPMLPKGMVNDLIISITPLSLDKVNNMGVPAIIGTSLAIMAAGIPFEGPVGAVRIGYKDGEFIINPTYEEVKDGLLDLVLGGTEDTITMVEAAANEVDTDTLMKAFEIGQEQLKKICQMQKQFLAQLDIQTKEITLNKPSEELMDWISQRITEDKLSSIFPSTKEEFGNKYNEFLEQLMEEGTDMLEDEQNNEFTNVKMGMGLFDTVKKYIRKRMLTKGERLDGRKLDQVRPLYCQVGLFPRVHGSSIFQRGETQALNSATLGAPGDVQLMDTMEEDFTEKRFIHHYNMPGFSNNEPKPSRFPSRREIGHGRLAEKALEPVIPDEETFPYTIRLVTEITSSNGSTSMAATCSSTLSLMDAGVPIKSPVSGIAMGLVHDEEGNYKILTDIQGAEDFTGDMDFKVTGTDKGITALQMDMKIKGLKLDIIKQAVEQANVGRATILQAMLDAIPEPRKELNPYAPKIITFKLEQNQVREAIGPGGETIKGIVKETGAKIDFKDDGTCIITAKDQDTGTKAEQMIKDAARQPTEGETMEGKVVRVENYGVFVELKKGKRGLCHVKNLGQGYIQDASTLYKVGDSINVEIMGVDKDGKVNLKKI